MQLETVQFVLGDCLFLVLSSGVQNGPSHFIERLPTHQWTGALEHP